MVRDAINSIPQRIRPAIEQNGENIRANGWNVCWTVFNFLFISSKQNRMKFYILCRKCQNFSLFYQRTKSFSFLDFLCRCQNSFCFSLSALNTISITFTPVLFFVCSFITTVHIAEVYKHTIEGSETDMENYGQEVRRAIRLSRVRVMRSKNRQKILSERTKDKQFNYFHYP